MRAAVQLIIFGKTSSAASAPAAPTLTLISAPSVNTPSFTLVGDLELADVVRFQYDTQSSFATASVITNTITAPEQIAGELDFSTGALADGAWWFRARIERGAAIGAWSNVVTETIASTDAATTAWVNAVVGAGGAVSATQKSRVNTLIVALKTAASGNLFALADRIWLYAGESDAHQAAIDLAHLATGTVHGSPTFGAGGYTGDGTAAYIDTGFNPVSVGGNFTQNSATLAVYVRTNNATYDSGVFLGGGDGASSSHIFINQNSASAIFGKINTSNFTTAPASTQQGLWVSTRTGATTHAVYRDGNTTPVGTDSLASTGLANVNLFSLAFNNNGTPSVFVPDQVAIVAILGGLSAAQQADFSAAANAYMTAWVVNVYP